MKRFFAVFLAAILMLGLCACGSGGNTTGTGANEGNKAVIAEELQGKWYGPNSKPQLDIDADGTGKITLNDETFDATFTAENNVFTAVSDSYYLSGDYTLESEKLTVKLSFEDKEYKVIFTRTPVELPDDSFIYILGDETYEINFNEGEIILSQFPPEDDPPIIEVYFEYITETIIHVHPQPPIFEDEVTIIQPSNTGGFPHPEEIDISVKEEPQIIINGDPTPGYISNDDITGTWTTVQDGTVSIFGVTNSATVPITYTFNADGTGTILAMGIIPGTMTYSVENGVLNLTVSMLGDTESGTGYVKRAGDKLLIRNIDDEIEILTRQ